MWDGPAAYTSRDEGLNYLSAQCPFGTLIAGNVSAVDKLCLNYLSAQCPFGTCSCRHTPESPPRRCLNYLSAQCPFGTPLDRRGRCARRYRLNYLSAQCPFGTATIVGLIAAVILASQLPFGSVPFRHSWWSWMTPPGIRCLNYLSAQCPFGTRIPAPIRANPPASLNYLSAQCPFGTSNNQPTMTRASR